MQKEGGKVGGSGEKEQERKGGFLMIYGGVLVF